jgi:predicted RNA-binding protein Jag
MIEIETMKEKVVEFLKIIELEYTTLNITEKDNNKICIQIIPQKDLAPLYIGFRGVNLNAIQHLLKSILWDNGVSKDKFISVDIDHYREKNEQKILDILAEKIQMVETTGMAQVMPFLTAADRRMVHMTIAEKYADQVCSESFDDEKGKRTLKIIKKAETSEEENV